MCTRKGIATRNAWLSSAFALEACVTTEPISHVALVNVSQLLHDIWTA